MSKIIGNIDNISVTDNNGNIREIVCKIDISAFHKRIKDRQRVSQRKYKKTHTREKNQLISKSKKKRKFRAMTIRERCFNNKFTPCKDCEYRSGICCQYPESYLSDKDKPYKTRNGKYVLIEVKE